MTSQGECFVILAIIYVVGSQATLPKSTDGNAENVLPSPNLLLDLNDDDPFSTGTSFSESPQHSSGNLPAGRSPPAPRIILSGLANMFGTLTNGINTQKDLLIGGLRQAKVDLVAIKTNLTQQAINSVQVGKQMIRYTIEQASLPTVAAAVTMGLNQMEYYVQRNGMDVQTVPGIESQMFGFGSFRTSNGSLSSISSVTQDGPVSVTVRNLIFQIAVPLRFKDLKLVYDEYNFSTWGMNLNGKIVTKVKDNAFIARVQLATGCLFTVERIDVVRFRDFDVDITGLCRFCSAIASFIINFMQETFQKEVQKAIDEGIDSLLRDRRGLICSRLTRSA